MNDYFLAKLIDSVDEINSRKRLQKAVYLLQFREGFPLQLHYFLHYYGPFSRELAQLIDQLDSSQIISEEENTGQYGFTSGITSRGKDVLTTFEDGTPGNELKLKISPFIEPFKKIIDRDLWDLELASTIAYYYTASKDWEKAKVRTANFKKVEPEDPNLTNALQLAKETVGTDEGQAVS